MTRVSPELLGRLLDEHGNALVLYARQWCDLPEDVVQEAFIKLAGRPETPENVVAWLYRVVRNGALEALRSAGRRRRHEAAAGKGKPWFSRSSGDRLDAVEAAQALERLPGEQREVIVARLWGGLSFDQIAGLMGTSSSTAHRWYQSGLEALRERLRVECPTQNTSLTN